MDLPVSDSTAGLVELWARPFYRLEGSVWRRIEDGGEEKKEDS